MDSEDRPIQSPDLSFHDDAAQQFKVTYVHTGRSKKAGSDRNQEFTRKRTPVYRSVNSAGRVKRVVSCKRKTHHSNRKKAGGGRSSEVPSVGRSYENQRKSSDDLGVELFTLDQWDDSNLDEKDCSTLAELSDDHRKLTEVLFGRILRLKVAFTLWRRNSGELLTFLLREPDISVLVDFLPVITRSLEEACCSVTVGCCVDLLPLVQNILRCRYEEYLIVGLKWINSVLRRWSEELKTSGCRGETKGLDRNYQEFNRNLLSLWEQEPWLRFLPGDSGLQAEAVDSFLSQLA